MRSFVFFSTFVLSFALFQLVASRATNQDRIAKRDNSANVVANYIRELFGLTARQAQTCVEDEVYQEVFAYPSAQDFCSRLLEVPTAVETVYTTPASYVSPINISVAALTFERTVTDVYTTNTVTRTNVIRTTPTITTTVTAGAKIKRSLAKGKYEVGAVARFMRVAEASGTATADATFVSALSSACSCFGPTASTSTVFYTDAPTTYTQRVYVNTVQTINTTSTARTAIATVTESTVENTTLLGVSTITPLPSASPTAISPAIVCPNDDNTLDSQLIDGQLFHYLVQCDTDITDDNLAQYRYSAFTECAAACGAANYGFSSAVCQGAVFYPGATSGSNCFLKKSANSTVVAGGINAVVLQSIEVAVTDPATPSAVYASTSSSDVDTSSMLSSIFQDSTTSMPIITPAPAVSNARLATSYSTYVSDGSTYSSAMVYSTYYSSDGSWYYSYYTTYTVAWAASSTQEVAYATSSSSSSIGSGEGAGGASGGAAGGAGGSSGNSTSGNSTGVDGGSNGGAAGGSGAGSSSSYTETITVYNTTTYTGNQQIQNETIVTTHTWSNGTSESFTSTTITVTTIGTSSGGTSGNSSSEVGGSSGSSGGSGGGSSSGGSSGGSLNGTTSSGNGGGSGGIVTNGTVIVTNSTIITNNTISTNGTAGGESGGSNGGAAGGAAGNVSTRVIVSTIYSTAVSTVYLSASVPFSGSSSDAGRSGTASPSPFPLTNSTVPPVSFPTPISVSIPLFNSSSGAYVPPFATGSSPSGSPSPSVNATATSSSPFSGSSSGGNRSGTRSPVTSPYTFSNASTIVGPTGTAPSTGPFTSDLRSGTESVPTATPVSNSSIPIPLSTGVPSLNSTSVVPSASLPFPSVNSSVPFPTGTAPSASFPFPTANSSMPFGPTGTAPSSGFPFPTANSSIPIGATGTPFTPSGTTDLRSGTRSTFMPTGASSGFPVTNATCTEMPSVTVTFFSTVTEAASTIYATTTLLGCYSNCPPAGGYYGPFQPAPTSPA